MWMGYQSHMDLPEQDNISGHSLRDLQRFVIPATQTIPAPALVEELLPPMWEMTISAKVGILGQEHQLKSIQVTHSGMVRTVQALPAVS